MADQDNTVLLRVQLDVGKTEERLQQLVLDIESTRLAQKALNEARKQGAVTDAEFAAQSVKLQADLKNQRTEQTALSKNLALYQKAVSDVGGSYDGLQAQLSLAQRQFQLLEGSADNSSESAQVLGKTIEELRNTLKATDETQSLFVRNVGNYPKGEELAPLIQQLIKLQEQQKLVGAGSAEYEKVTHQIGFLQQAAVQAGAKSGLSYEQTEAKLISYGEAVRPAIANLVKLEQEQEQVGEVGSEAYRKIGFQMAALEKQLEQTTEPTQEVTQSLTDAVAETGLFGDTIGQLTTAKARYTAVVNAAKAATAAETTVLGGLKLALLATGVGAFVVLLGSLVAFLSKTQAGTDFVSRKLAALGAVVTTVTNLAADFGQTLFEAAENPKQAFSDLLDFMGTNLMNRLKSFGVIVEGILDLDAGKIADGFIQAGTGITDVTAKARSFGQTLGTAAAEGERLAQLQKELDRATDDNIDTNKRLLNEVERLKNVRDNEFNSLSVRRKANEEAFKVEQQREQTLADLARRRIAVLKGEMALAGGREKVSREQYQTLKEAENELADILEDAAGKQNELLTNRYQLNKEGVDAEKEAAKEAAAAAEKRREKELAARREALQLDLFNIDRRLRAVKEGSDEELSLLQQKLERGKQLELAQAKLTVGQKKLIEEKYQQDSDKLLEESGKKRLASELDRARILLQVQLAGVRQGGQEELLLRQQLLQQQLNQEVAALDTRRDNTAQEALLRQNTAKEQRELEFQQALKFLEEELQARRNRLNQEYANGHLTKQQQEAALSAIERAGLEARLVTLQDYGRQTLDVQAQLDANAAAARDKRLADAQTEATRRQGLQESILESSTSVTDGIIRLFGEESEAGQAALALKKTFALAEIAINLQLELSAIAKAAAANPLNIPTAGAAGITQAAILSGLAIAKAAFATAQVLLFEGGGVVGQEGDVVRGPSHRNGGVPFRVRGQGGYEMEGGEIILSKGVFQNKKLFAAASALNVAGGGKPLASAPYMALGGVASPYVREALAGPQAVVIDYDKLAAALQKVNLSVSVRDTAAAQARKDFTDRMANS
jgi:hypothetical protein